MTRMMAAGPVLATGIAAILLAGAAPAQEITRTELNRADLSGSDAMEVVVSLQEIPPGATVPRHSHPGDEHVIVREGGPLTTPDGNTIEFKPGMAIDFPAGEVHGGLTASGDAPIVIYTVHVVPKGEPLYIPAE